MPSFALPIPHRSFLWAWTGARLTPHGLAMSPHSRHFSCGSSLCRKETGQVPGALKQTSLFALGRSAEGVQSSQVLGPVLRGLPHATFKTSPPERKQRPRDWGVTCPHHTAGKRRSQAWNCTQSLASRSNSRQPRGNGSSEAKRRTGVASWTGIPPTPHFWGPPLRPPRKTMAEDGLLIRICSSCHLGRDQLHFTDVETEAGRGLEGPGPALPSQPPAFPAVCLHFPGLSGSGGRRRH